MHTGQGMRINLDIQTHKQNANDWIGGFKLKLNTPGLKGSLDFEPSEKRNNSSTKKLHGKPIERLPSDTSRYNLTKLYSGLKRIKKPSAPYETERKKYDPQVQDEKRLSFNGNKKHYCDVTVVDGENRKRHMVAVQKISDLLDALREGDNQITTYYTVPSNLTIDFYLTQPNREGSFLNGQTLVLRPYYRSSRKKIDMRCFDILKCIGAGGFSKVFLVRYKEDGKFYAMKLIDKHFIAENNKKGIVENQRNIMVGMKHPFILEMKFSFETLDFLVFVLEYCPGGELFTYVKKLRRMPEDVAKFYMIEILLAIEHLHSHNIIYRDIKPENILIDLDGHVKLADFGLAKPQIGRQDMAYSFCGSPQYMAPQMILKMGHGPPVDFYCIGALLYQLVTGLPPFYSKNTEQIYESVLTEQLTFPRHTQLSQECENILVGLLNKNYKQRLGSFFGVKEVLAHPWFGRFKRQQVIERKLTPPIKIDDPEELKFDFERHRQSQCDLMGLITEQKRSENQYFRKLMKNFYYDSRQILCCNSDDGSNQEEQDVTRPTIKLHQKRTENTPENQRYFSPRHQQSQNYYRVSSKGQLSTSRLKKVSTGKTLAFKKKGTALLSSESQNLYLPKPTTPEKTFRKVPISKLKQTYNKTFRS